MTRADNALADLDCQGCQPSIDGLALGDTTPGLLVMVVAFVGLFRFGVGMIIPLTGACGAAVLAYTFARQVI